MDEFILWFCQLVTVVITVKYLFYNIRELWGGKRGVVLYLYPLIFIFYALLPLLQFFMGRYGAYRQWKGILEAMGDPWSRILYLLFLDLFVILLWRYYRSARRTEPLQTWKNTIFSRDRTVIRYGLMFVMYAPVGYIITHPTTREIVLAGYVGRSINETHRQFPVILTSLTMLCTIAFLMYLYVVPKNKYFSHVLAVAAMLFAAWINGKRYIFFETIIFAFFILSMTNKVNTKKLFGLAMVVFPLLVGLAYLYQILYKPDAGGFLGYLEIDFSRDYGVILSIYRELIHKPILEFRGQSMLYNLFFWVPRVLFPQKPWPYAQYFTNAALGRELSDFEPLGWGTTTTIFSEFLTNFGWIGLILSIFIVLALIRRIDTVKQGEHKIFLLYFVVRLLTVELASCLVAFVMMWLILFLLNTLQAAKDQYHQHLGPVTGTNLHER